MKILRQKRLMKYWMGWSKGALMIMSPQINANKRKYKAQVGHMFGSASARVCVFFAMTKQIKHILCVHLRSFAFISGLFVVLGNICCASGVCAGVEVNG